MTNTKITFFIFLCLLCFGCTSPKITVKVLQTYQYESVYDADTDITINSQKIERDKKTRVWLLTDRTLSYMLEAARSAKKQNTSIMAEVE